MLQNKNYIYNLLSQKNWSINQKPSSSSSKLISENDMIHCIVMPQVVQKASVLSLLWWHVIPSQKKLEEKSPEFFSYLAVNYTKHYGDKSYVYLVFTKIFFKWFRKEISLVIKRFSGFLKLVLPGSAMALVEHLERNKTWLSGESISSNKVFVTI